MGNLEVLDQKAGVECFIKMGLRVELRRLHVSHGPGKHCQKSEYSDIVQYCNS